MMKWPVALLLGIIASVPTAVHGQWYASVDFVALTRSDGSETVFQRSQEEELDTDGNPTGDYLVESESLLTAGNLDLGLVAGGRITTGYRTDQYGFELSYLFSDEWASSASVHSTAAASDLAGLMASPFSRPGAIVDPASPVDSNSSAVVGYKTEMQSGEMHFTRKVTATDYGDAWLLFGARFMSINESLAYVSSNAIQDTVVRNSVANSLAGPQIGLLTETVLPGGFLDLDLKFALAYNSIDKTTQYSGVLGSGDDDAAVALGEFGVKYRFQPRPNFAVHVGYHLVALSGVALATDNFESNLDVLLSGLARVDRGTAVYHAPYIGIVIAR